jgi:hypothetical protein
LLTAEVASANSFGQNEDEKKAISSPDPNNNNSVVIRDESQPLPYFPDKSNDYYIEKWMVSSSRTTNGGTLDKQYMLSPSSFFKFLDGTHIILKLNEFYPVQFGEFAQTMNEMNITLYKNSNCTQCIEQMKITRKTPESKELLLEFNGHQQIFTIDKIRKNQ